MIPQLDLGPLQDILGVWRGEGKDTAFPPGGVPVESDYIEEMVVRVVPVMQVTKTLFIHAAAYETKLVDAKNGNPLHHEFGYWAWIPESLKALRIIAIGRALGVVATCDMTGWPGSKPNVLKFLASTTSSPVSIATTYLGNNVPTMEEFICDVTFLGNAFTYDQMTKVRLPGMPQLVNHTDKATLKRQP